MIYAYHNIKRDDILIFFYFFLDSFVNFHNLFFSLLPLLQLTFFFLFLLLPFRVLMTYYYRLRNISNKIQLLFIECGMKSLK